MTQRPADPFLTSLLAEIVAENAEKSLNKKAKKKKENINYMLSVFWP